MSIHFRWARYLLPLMAIALVAVIATACTTAEEETTTTPEATVAVEEPKELAKIVFSDTQFESLWINNAIAQYIIENGYGNPTETIVMTTPIMQTSLTNGDIDVNMELWEQNIIDWYDEGIAAGTMVNGGETYEGGPQFFMIPLWVHEQYNLNTIDDMLNAETAKLFQDPEDSDKGYFINCAIGWQCAEINRAKAKTYGLDDYYNIITPGTAAAMDAAYHGAQKKENPIFGYYWAPTSLMGMYDWYILEEPENTPECWAEVIKGRDDATYTPAEACAYETLPVSKGMNSGLAAKAPEVSAMLNKMNTGLQPINVTAAWSVENEIQDYEKVAIYYLNNYEDRWATWMPADKVAKVKAALANES